MNTYTWRDYKGKATKDYYRAGNHPNSDDKSYQKLLDKAIGLHQKGVAGDTEAINEAFKLLGEIRVRVPQDNLVNAYYGSIITLIGRDTVDLMKRFEKTLKGLIIIDQTVEKEPNNAQIRILRANVCLRLPETYFQRTATAIEDYNYLIARYENDSTVFPDVLYFQFLYDLGVAYHNLGQEEMAKTAWDKLRVKTEAVKYHDYFKSNESMGFGMNGALTEPLTKVLEEGTRLHQNALIGDKKEISAATDFFAKALAVYPENELLEAYQADCLSLMGRDAINSSQMFASAIKAMKMFDNAVNRNPENIQVRFLRANHSFRVPESFFHRTAAAIADYEFIRKRYVKDNSILSEETYGHLLYNLGASYHFLGLVDEGVSVWDQLLPLPSGLNFKKKIDEQLRKNTIPVVRKNLSLTKNREEYYQEATRLHQMAVDGNKEAARLGLDLWEKAHERDPQDPLTLAYYGSSLALIGRDALEPTEIFGNAIRGLKMVNQAVSLDEENFQIRLLRGFFTYSLPEAFFHLTQQTIKDFQFVKQAYEQDSMACSKELYQQILHNLDKCYHRVGQDDRTAKTRDSLLKESSDSALADY